MLPQIKNLWNHVKLSPPWKYLIAFAIFAVGGIVLTLTTDSKLVHLFESFYRYGYLVIGGGQVVVPLMYSELVEVNQYMTNPRVFNGVWASSGTSGADV